MSSVLIAPLPGISMERNKLLYDSFLKQFDDHKCSIIPEAVWIPLVSKELFGIHASCLINSFMWLKAEHSEEPIFLLCVDQTNPFYRLYSDGGIATINLDPNRITDIKNVKYIESSTKRVPSICERKETSSKLMTQNAKHSNIVITRDDGASIDMGVEISIGKNSYSMYFNMYEYIILNIIMSKGVITIDAIIKMMEMVGIRNFNAITCGNAIDYLCKIGIVHAYVGGSFKFNSSWKLPENFYDMARMPV